MSWNNKAVKAFVSSIVETTKTRKELDIVKWAEENRYLGDKSESHRRGFFKYSRTPYMIEPANQLKNPDCKKLVLMTSTQVAKTELLLNAIGTVVVNDPSPVMFLLPTDEMAEDFSRGRVYDLISNCLSKNFPPLNSKSQRLNARPFAGGVLRIVGASTPNNVAAVPIKYLFADEVDRIPVLVKEGDALKLAHRRQTTYINHGAKEIYSGTPTLTSSSRINREHNKGTMCVFEVQCKHCKDWAEITMERLISNKKTNIVRLTCYKCGILTDEKHKLDLITNGRWVATNPNPKKGIYSYHIWAGMNPMVNWSDIMVDFFETQISPETLKPFYNTILGKPFDDEGEYTDPEALAKMSASYSIDNLPSEIKFLTIAVDVQKDRLELYISGWGQNCHFGIDYKVFKSTHTISSADFWRECHRYLNDVRFYQDGKEKRIDSLSIDTGHQAQEVYKFAPSLFKMRNAKTDKYTPFIFLVKGASQLGADPFTRPTLRANQPRLFMVGTQQIKSELRRMYSLDTYSFKWNGNFGAKYFKMLTAERQKGTVRNGQVVKVWENKKGRRNEALDLMVYSYHAQLALSRIRRKRKWDIK